MSYEEEYSKQQEEDMSAEEEYNKQQEEDISIKQNEPKKTSAEDEILINISSVLKRLSDENAKHQALIEKLTHQVQQINDSSVNLKKTSDEIINTMPKIVHEKCLDEYKKIVNNAAKNYNQLQKSIVSWHKNLEKDHDRMFKWISISSILTPVLLLILILLQLF
ncbi:MAG: hypothetical protein SO083_02950 [Megamonas funiformis]|jgi:DNA repair exonuclease SbcCD ATPase subunit|uniref:Transmembrane protein n=1 Tax=Candidatus Atopostipes pullistercoris TaxID=2838467 RepID=A0A9D2G177_9LACT|nr:hypothetical protein [Megamonas funiformis]MDY3874110.1 hypothetical protein [Megamonas funiformis]HIZ70240.1 hypothetical protein [Candidatus Atopostipes pullistercoris]